MPTDAKSWFDVFNSWIPGAASIAGIAFLGAVKMAWTDYKEKHDDDYKASRAEERDNRKWYRGMSARTREVVESTNKENDELRADNADLRKQLKEAWAECAREQASGMDHYRRCVRLYRILATKLPNETLTDMKDV